MSITGGFPAFASAASLLLPASTLLLADDSLSDAANQTVIQRVTVIDGRGGPAHGPVDVMIEDGRIADISSAPLEVEGAQTLVAAGKFLVPGLIDAHTHPFPVEETFPQFIGFGVISILVTGCGQCDDETLRRNREATMREDVAAPRFFHTSQHFSMVGRHPVKTYPGPRWVDGKTIHFIDSVAEIGPLVERVTRQPIVGIKVTIEDGPAPPFVERMPQAFVDEIVTQAHAHGTRVFAHVSDIEDLRMAQQAGVDHLLHFTGVGNRYIFPGFSLHEELELLEMAGISAADILVMATRNGAELLGADDELGTLEIGKRADMLLLGADPTERVRNLRTIEAVFRDGREVWRQP